MRRQQCRLPPCEASAQRMSAGMLLAAGAGRHPHFVAMRRAVNSGLRRAHHLRTFNLIGMLTFSLRCIFGCPSRSAPVFL